MNKKTFTYSSQIDRPAHEVFDWHLRPGAFDRLVPPWKRVKMLSKEDNPSREGAVVRVAVRIGFLWKTWVFEHRGFVPGQEFSDIQIKGPFRYWRHVHRVVAKSDRSSLLEDRIEYKLPIPFFNSFLKKDLSRIFTYRHATLAKDLETYARYSTPQLRILVSGSSGLIGKNLVSFLKLGGHQVVCLLRDGSRSSDPSIVWDPSTGKARKEDFEDFDAVVHLAGKNIFGLRLSEKDKEAIFLSRCRDTWLLAQILNRLHRPPKTMICASAIGIYGDCKEELVTESHAKGSGFLADLCIKWEESSDAIESRGTRVVRTRFGVVLSPKGGMLSKVLPLFRLGLGGKLGNGRQFFSWVALDDVLGGIYHCLMNPNVSGPVNFVSPSPVRNAEFVRILAKILHRPAFFHVPEKILEVVFGDMAHELFLASVKAAPEQLLQSGYSFRFDRLENALCHYLGKSYLCNAF